MSDTGKKIMPEKKDTFLDGLATDLKDATNTLGMLRRRANPMRLTPLSFDKAGRRTLPSPDMPVETSRSADVDYPAPLYPLGRTSMPLSYDQRVPGARASDIPGILSQIGKAFKGTDVPYEVGLTPEQVFPDITQYGNEPIDIDAFGQQYRKARGWTPVHRGVASDEELAEEDRRIREITKAYREQTGASLLDIGGQRVKRTTEMGWDVLRAFGRVPQQTVASLLQLQGQGGASVVNKDAADRFIDDANKDYENFITEMKAKYEGELSAFPITMTDLAESVKSIGYSAVSMGAGLTAAPVALIPFPGMRALAWALGTAASGAAAYSMTTYQIMQEYLEAKNDEKIAKSGSGLTLEEENQLKKDFDSKAREYGLWEAVPEAISNLLFAQVLAGPLGKMMGKTIATRIISKLVGIYGEELLTETITQKMQSRVEVEAGLRDKNITWLEAFKEVAPQTFLLTTIMGGAGQLSVSSYAKIKQSLSKEVGANHPLVKTFSENIKEAVGGALTDAYLKTQPAFAGEKGEKPVTPQVVSPQAEPQGAEQPRGKIIGETKEVHTGEPSFLVEWADGSRTTIPKTEIDRYNVETPADITSLEAHVAEMDRKSGEELTVGEKNIYAVEADLLASLKAKDNYEAGTKERVRLDAEINRLEKERAELLKEQPSPTVTASTAQTEPGEYNALTPRIDELKHQLDLNTIKERYPSQKQALTKAVKDRLYNVIKTQVPLPVQGKMMTAFKNVRTASQLIRAIDRAYEVADEYDRSQIRKAIYKEIAPTKVKHGRGKFTADIQSKLDVFRKSLRASSETRENMILDNTGKALANKITYAEARELNHLIRLAELGNKNALALNDILTQIKEFKATGKLVRLAEKVADTRKRIGYDSPGEAALDLAGKLPPKKPRGLVTDSSSKWERIGNAIDSFITSSYRVEGVLREWDGFIENGAFYTTVYKPINESATQKTTGVRTESESIQKFFKDNKINVGKIMSDKLKIRDKTIRGPEKIGIYLHSLNADNLRHVIEGNGFTQEEVNQVIQSLTAEERLVAEYFRKYYKRAYLSIAEIYEKLTGVKLNQVDNYAPMKTDKTKVGGEVDLQASLSQEDLLRERTLIPSASIKKGFTKTRTKATQPIKLDSFALYMSHLNDTEHYKAYEATVRDLQQILLNKDFANAVKAHSGYNKYQMLIKWLETAAKTDPYKVANSAEGFLRMLRTNASSAVLGAQIVVAMKQPASFLLGAAEIGELNAIEGLYTNIAHPTETGMLIKEYDPQTYARSMEREIAEMKAMHGITGRMKTREMFMLLTTTLDKITVNSIWRGAFDSQLKQGKTPEQSAEYAAAVVRRTQPFWSAKDIPEIYRSNEFMKTLTMFTNQINQNWNYLRWDVYGKTKAGKQSYLTAVRKILIGYALTNLLLGMVTSGKIKKKPEEYAEDLLIGGFTLIPIFGTFISSALKGFRDASVITLAPIQKIQETAYYAGKGNTGKAVQKGVEGVGVFTGLPVAAAGKAWDVIEVADEKGWDAWRELIYGSYQATQQRKPAKEKVLADSVSMLGSIDEEARDRELEKATGMKATSARIAELKEKDYTHTTSKLAADIARNTEEADEKNSKLVKYYWQGKAEDKQYELMSSKEKESYAKSRPEYVLWRLFWHDQGLESATSKQKAELKELAQAFGISENAIPALVKKTSPGGPITPPVFKPRTPSSAPSATPKKRRLTPLNF